MKSLSDDNKYTKVVWLKYLGDCTWLKALVLAVRQARSCGLSIVIAQQTTQVRSALDPTGCLAYFRLRDDQLIAKTLMIAFRMIVPQITSYGVTQ
jgi:hypothetical protein